MAEIQQGCSKCCLLSAQEPLRDGNQCAISQICDEQEPEGWKHIPHPPHQPPHKYKTSNAQRSVGLKNLGKPPLDPVSLSWFLYSTLYSSAATHSQEYPWGCHQIKNSSQEDNPKLQLRHSSIKQKEQKESQHFPA